MEKEKIKEVKTEYFTDEGLNITERITLHKHSFFMTTIEPKKNTTLFFTIKQKAQDYADSLRSYVYNVEQRTKNQSIRGFGVPK